MIASLGSYPIKQSSCYDSVLGTTHTSLSMMGTQKEDKIQGKCQLSKKTFQITTLLFCAPRTDPHVTSSDVKIENIVPLTYWQQRSLNKNVHKKHMGNLLKCTSLTNSHSVDRVGHKTLMQVALRLLYSFHIQLRKLRVRHINWFSQGHIGRNVADPGFQPRSFDANPW